MSLTTARHPTPGINSPNPGASPSQTGTPRLSSTPAAPSPRKRLRTTTRSRDWDTGGSGSGSPSKSKEAGTGERERARAGPGPAATAPDASFVSPAVASSAMCRFLAAHVAREGFESAEAPALYRLEVEVVSFVEQIFARAKAYAEIANRSLPNAEDALAAAGEYDIDIDELIEVSRKHKRKQKRGESTKPDLGLELVLPPRRSESPELLPSDDESGAPSVPQTLQALPSHMPPLPPKHTYLRTPVPPPKKQALPSLEKKLENAALVQESLRNLLLATEVDADANDGELFGGVVNWEATRHPRKKWKIRV